MTRSIDHLNREVYSDAASRFIAPDSWVDPGERAAISMIADQGIRDHRILDVGVGGGRTTWLLRLISFDYVGVEYAPALVDIAQHNHPSDDIRLGDARDLKEFADGYFSLVVFSFNGLDTIPPSDRLRVFHEFHRVLAPGGWLLFSGLNKDGRAFRETPWAIGAPDANLAAKPRAYRMLRFIGLLPFKAQHYAHSYRNWWELRNYTQDYVDWGVSTLKAHDFGLVVFFSTLDHQRAELERAGFTLEQIWANDGQFVDSNSQSRALYHHFVCRREVR
jgi:SAM-dependent methyltransferase